MLCPTLRAQARCARKSIALVRLSSCVCRDCGAFDQLLFKISSHPAQPRPRGIGVGKTLHTLGPLPFPTADHTVGIQASGMMVGRPLRPVLCVKLPMRQAGRIPGL